MKTFKSFTESYQDEKAKVEKAIQDHKAKFPNDRIVKMLVPGEKPSRIHVHAIQANTDKQIELGSYVRPFEEDVDPAQKKRVVIDMDESYVSKNDIQTRFKQIQAGKTHEQIIDQLKKEFQLTDLLMTERGFVVTYQQSYNTKPRSPLDEDASEDFERAKKELDDKKVEFKKKADDEKSRAREQEFKEKQREQADEFAAKQREEKSKREQKYREQEDKRRDQERQRDARKAQKESGVKESIEDKFNKEFLNESVTPKNFENALQKSLKMHNADCVVGMENGDVIVFSYEKQAEEFFNSNSSAKYIQGLRDKYWTSHPEEKKKLIDKVNKWV